MWESSHGFKKVATYLQSKPYASALLCYTHSRNDTESKITDAALIASCYECSPLAMMFGIWKKCFHIKIKLIKVIVAYLSILN